LYDRASSSPTGVAISARLISKPLVKTNVGSVVTGAVLPMLVPVPVAVPFLGSAPNRNELITFGRWEILCLTVF
jgi:hypothetical protein